MRNLYLPVLISCALAVGASSQQSAPSKSPAAQKPALTPQSSGQKQSGQPPADKVENKTADKTADLAKAGERDYSQESFVVEKMHTSYKFESDGTGRKELIARIRVQSEAGVQQWGQLQLGYNSANERVEIPYVRVLKEDGRDRKSVV